MIENIRQGNKDQVRAAVRIYAERIAGREDDQTGKERHKGIQCGNPHGFSEKCVLLADVAPENGDGSDSETQSEESLIHGSDYRRTDADVRHPFKIRQQVKF